jgi:hypothetical protein
MLHYMEMPSNDDGPGKEALSDSSAGHTSPKRVSGNDRLKRQHQEALARVQETLLQLTQAVGELQGNLLLNKDSLGDALHTLLRLSLSAEAMQLSVNLLTDDPAIAEHTLDTLQQLRRRTGKWKRTSHGWFELRYANGSGPYLYHRYRGEDGKKYTQYYGRLEKLQEQVEIDAVDTTDQD